MEKFWTIIVSLILMILGYVVMQFIDWKVVIPILNIIWQIFLFIVAVKLFAIWVWMIITLFIND